MNSQQVQEEVKNELNDLMANFSLGAKPLTALDKKANA